MFGRPKGGKPTRHLFVGNCGPGVGIDAEALENIFKQFGTARVIVPEHQENPRSAFVFATFDNEDEATAALLSLNGRPCASAGGRKFTVKYADLKKEPSVIQQHVAVSTKDCQVEGLTLIQDFVSEEEEQALIACTEQSEWETLARRRVCHFGYRFEYKSRNVDPQRPIQPFPAALQPVLHRLHALSQMPQVDQCTVNEYPAGVGLSPHIDTHSAFSGAIASLSLAGPAVMEFRQAADSHAILLPPRSLLVMAGPARYCWQHYIPHRKADHVQGALLPRAPRRMSFTFRQVRGHPCKCQWPEHCDSQQSSLPPTRMAQRAGQSHPTAPIPSSEGHQAPIAAPSQPIHQGPATQQPISPSTPSTATKQSEPNGQQTEPAQLPGQKASSQLQLGSTTQAKSRGGSTGSPAGQGEMSRADEGRQDEVPPAADADLERLEQEFVHDVYNAIAPHFSATRFAIWPKVRQFIEGLAAGSLVADVGCGNGKYFMVRQDIAVLGSDRSSGLAHVAASRLAAGTGAAAGSAFKADVAVADGMRLPYASSRFDAALSIAVLHHVTTPARRIHMLTELLRILRPGGSALITVWATNQEDMKKLAKWQPIDRPGSAQQSHPAGLTHGPTVSTCLLDNDKAATETLESPLSTDAHTQDESDKLSLEATSSCCAAPHQQFVHKCSLAAESGKSSQTDKLNNDYFVPWHLPFHRAEAAMQVLKAGQVHDAVPAAGSIRIDNAKQSVVFSRYYHVYEQFELDQLVELVPGAEVLDSFYDKDNWCVVMGKRL